jgi:hypothetical protein
MKESPANTLKWPAYLLLLATASIGAVLLIISVPLSLYIVDAFGLYSASAMTIILVARCLGGTLIPLAIPVLTDALGFGYGFLVLAAIFVALIPIPMVILRYGSHLRQNSKFTAGKNLEFTVSA